MTKKIVSLTFAASLLTAFAAWAADVPAQLDTAKAAWAKGDLSRAAREIESALAQTQQKLGRSLVETLPAPPAGWQAEAADVQGLAQAGGGLQVGRAYTKGEASLNASILVDNASAEDVKALFASVSGTGGTRRVKVGAEDALLRFDAANSDGEITMILGGRVVMEVQGDGIHGADILVETAKGWNIARIKALTGL
jgi:hypothetical protein